MLEITNISIITTWFQKNNISQYRLLALLDRFDCLWRDLFIKKFQADGFDNKLLDLVQKYLSN